MRLADERRGEETASKERDEGPAFERVAGAGSEVSRLDGEAIVAEGKRLGQREGSMGRPAPVALRPRTSTAFVDLTVPSI